LERVIEKEVGKEARDKAQDQLKRKKRQKII
jgi:hypothetical protein